MANNTKKCTFNIPEQEIKALMDLAQSEQESTTRLLRRAIKAELFMSKNYKEGNKILIKHSDGSLTEVIRG